MTRSIRSLARAALGAALLSTLAGPLRAAELPADTGVLAIEHVAVVSMEDDRVRPDQTVLIRDGRITWVGSADDARVPGDARRIDGRGRYLMPGLAEMHAHVPPGNAPPQLVEDILFLYLANGITTIRGMLGAPYQLDLRDRIESGEVLGPRFLVGAPSLNGNSAADPATAARLVREHAEAGYDFLKLHPGLSRAAYDAIVDAAAAAGITTGGHISVDVGLHRTLEAGQGTIDHMDGYLEASLPDAVHARLVSPTDTIPLGEVWSAADQSRLPELARATREAGVWVVPTAFLWESLYGPLDPEAAAAWPEMRYAPRSMVQGWIQQKRNIRGGLTQAGVDDDDIARYLAFRRSTLRELGEQDVGLLLGTDSPQLFSVPGFSLHREMRFMQEQGITPYQIARSGTVNVARYVEEVLGREADFGTVAVGQAADLVLLRANPLEDAGNIAEPAGVVVAGRWISESEIAEGLRAIAARNPGR